MSDSEENSFISGEDGAQRQQGQQGQQATTITEPARDEDMASLPAAITSWRKNMDDITQLKAQIREKNKHAKVLEDLIMKVMKKNGIDALALRNSGGRVRLKQTKRLEGLGPKNLERLLTEKLGNADEAKKTIEFIQGKRVVKDVSKLVHESLAT
jgi:hypothetical protein